MMEDGLDDRAEEGGVPLPSRPPSSGEGESMGGLSRIR